MLNDPNHTSMPLLNAAKTEPVYKELFCLFSKFCLLSNGLSFVLICLVLVVVTVVSVVSVYSVLPLTKFSDTEVALDCIIVEAIFEILQSELTKVIFYDMNSV